MKIQKRIEKIMMYVILLLYPLRHIRYGVDLMDAGYSLGHFVYRSDVDQTWKLATYLSNGLGHLLTYLPFGKYWVGMNVYTGLFVSAIAIVIFCWCSKNFPEKEWLFFFAELFALSLCWAPTTILYHYLGYYGFSITAMLLYVAICKNDKKRFVIAGVILGACVIARMPNITYIALILPVWYGAFLWRKDRKANVMLQTGLCVAGFIASFGMALLLISFRYGLQSYPEMIHNLFGMTDTATDYKPSEMVFAMVRDYVQYSPWFFLFFLYLMLGVGFYHIFDKKENNRYIMLISKVCYGLGMPVLIRFCYGRGMFGVDYRDYFSMYKCVTVFLLVVLCLCIMEIVKKENSKEDRVLAFLLLVIIMITPLGSNNGLYPVINNLFFIAPVAVHFGAKEYRRYWQNFAVKTFLPFLGICLLVQVFLFGCQFVFHDHEQPKRALHIEGFPTTEGMCTNVDKADALEELGGYLYPYREKQLLLYGDIPALSYIYQMRSAIFTTWVDLNSNSLGTLQRDIGHLKHSETIVILSREKQDTLFGNTTVDLTKKDQEIKNLLAEQNYEMDFENQLFVVYQVH